MTKAEKIEWLANATNEQVLNQIEWAVVAMRSENVAIAVEGNEDYALIKAELLKRMA